MSEDKATQTPDSWSGPHFTFSVSETAEAPTTDKRFWTHMCGLHSRVHGWEHTKLVDEIPSIQREYEDHKRPEGKLLASLEAGSEECLTRFTASNSKIDEWSFELSLVIESGPGVSSDSWGKESRQVLEKMLPTALADYVLALSPINPDAVNEHRAIDPTSLPETLKAEVKDRWSPYVVDIPVDTLPSTRRRIRPLISTTRWVRFIIVKNGVISLWHDPNPKWDSEAAPWPHTGLPTRPAEELEELFTSTLTAKERINRCIQDAFRHERYFADSWFSEVEYWQYSAGTWLTDSGMHTSKQATEEVEELRKDLGTLANYVGSVRWAERALNRRPSAAGIPEGHCTAESWREALASLERQLEEMRRVLTECFTLYNAINQKLQLEQARKAEAEAQASREASDRLTTFLTLFTSILFIPTIVSGVYGANLELFNSGARGSIVELLIFMVASALISYGGISFLQAARKQGTTAIIGGLLSLIVFAVTHYTPLRAYNAVGTCLAVVFAALSILAVAIQHSRRIRSERN